MVKFWDDEDEDLPAEWFLKIYWAGVYITLAIMVVVMVYRWLS